MRSAPIGLPGLDTLELDAFDAASHELITTQVDSGAIQLADALQLLERAHHVWPPEAASGSTQWLQSLIDGLCQLSSRDALTGLANRRQFELTLDREVDRVARSGEPALVLLADIDHFKRVNDTYGHAAGDLVIQSVGAVLQEAVRPMDSVARVGGEEFAMVLPNCAPAFGHQVAERIRRRVETQVIRLPGREQTLSVTISIGGAFAPQWVRSSAKLWLERADQQLYRAKHAGRNCTCLESPPVLVVSPEEKGLLFRATTFSDSQIESLDTQ